MAVPYGESDKWKDFQQYIEPPTPQVSEESEDDDELPPIPEAEEPDVTGIDPDFFEGWTGDKADTGGKFGCVRCGGVVGGPAEYKTGHVMIKVYPGEYVLTERQAADAKKAGAKLPEWGFQKEMLPKHISRNVKADRGGRNYARVHGRPPPLQTPSTWLDYSQRYNQME